MPDKIPTAESLLNETIKNYNEKVSHVYQFQFNKNEKEMFVSLIHNYALNMLEAHKEAIKEGAKLEFRGDEIIGINHESIETAHVNFLKENNLNFRSLLKFKIYKHRNNTGYYN